MKSFGKMIWAALVAVVCVAAPAHAEVDRMRIVSKTYDPASMATLTGTSTTVTVPGVVLGDACVAASSTIDAALIAVTCYISAADTVTIRLFNGTAGTIDLASSTWRVFVWPKGTR